MPPFGFTDDELNSITALALPLPVEGRGEFLRQVAELPSGYPPQVPGAGLVHRIATAVQRDFLGVAVPRPRGGKWR